LHDRFRKFFDLLHQEIAAQKEVNTPEVHGPIREAMMQFLIDNADLLPAYFTSESQIPPLPMFPDEERPKSRESPGDSARPPP
jgi:hypothetical protein